ncbi:MAG: alpha/beta hydrolase [Synechococcales cyanobacterium RU_4_20]|nr:alpha/beta hydrolase [Synechococcales cyanobacterium RU_4_20]NJR68741.1 alpha/beta hydrolase [Synechococcales cyanobacterium CRU_2_2]
MQHRFSLPSQAISAQAQPLQSQAIAIPQSSHSPWHKTLEFALAVATGTAIACLALMPKASALEALELNYGSMFKLDLPLSELETFAKTGKASDNLQLLLDVSKTKPAMAQQLLSKEMAVDSALAKRMLDSYLGEVLLKEMGSVVKPEAGREPWKDIRTAMVTASTDQKLSAIEVLNAYGPAKLSINGEKAMAIFGRMMSDFGDIQKLLGVKSLEDVTGALCPPKR